MKLTFTKEDLQTLIKRAVEREFPSYKAVVTVPYSAYTGVEVELFDRLQIAESDPIPGDNNEVSNV